MMLIYLDSSNRSFLTDFQFEYTLTDNLSDYLASDIDKKFAITYNKFDSEYSVHNYQDYLNKIITVSRASQAVFIFDSELHDSMALVSAYAPVTNVYWVTSGIINNVNVKQINNGDFFDRIKHLYKNNLPNLLDTLTPYQAKPFCFDALLGETKPHRTWVYNSIKQNNLADKFVISYRPNVPAYQGNIANNDNFILEPGTEILNKVGNTNTLARYFGVDINLSHIIPLEVYNKTAYSIVAETNYDNEFSFFTEKIAKPIAAKRLFVVFSGRGFLHNLRSMGFKTFDGIIDEGYDLIEDNDLRFNKAMDQVKLLCASPQDEILSKIKPIVEHNSQLLMSSEFMSDAFKQITNIIYGNS